MKYFLAAVVAFSIWGFFSWPLKHLSGYDPLIILIFRILFSILFLVIYLIPKKFFITELLQDWRKLPDIEQKKQKRYIFLNGYLLAFNWLAFIYTMNNISVRATSLAYLICPILTAFLAVYILKEQLNKLQWWSLILSIFACLFLIKDRPDEVISAGLIGLSYALFLVFQKRIFIRRGTLLLLFQLIIALPIVAIYCYIQPQPLILPKESIFYQLIILIAIGFTLIPLLLNTYALRGIPSSTVGMILNINPFIAFALSILYWKEPLNFTQALVYLMIFIAVILFNAQLIKKIFPQKINF